MTDQTEFARHLRRTMSTAEQRLWSVVRARRLGAKFRRQAPRGPYFLDFVCLEHRLVLEVDGPHHAHRAGRDAERDAWLAAHGFRVLRFWHTDVIYNLDGVRSAVVAALAAAAG